MERDLQDRAKTTSVEIARFRHLIFGIFPNVNITKHNLDANSAKSVWSGILMLTQPSKKEKWWKRICCFIEEFRGKWVAYSGGRAAEIQVDFFYRRAQNPWDRSSSFISQWAHYAPLKNRERKGPSQRVIQKCKTQDRIPRSPKFEDGSQEETLQQERCARREAWEMANKCPRVERQGQSHILRHQRHHLRRNLRKKNLWWIPEHQCTC